MWKDVSNYNLAIFSKQSAIQYYEATIYLGLGCNRLTQVSLNGMQTEAYQYDANGNRVLSTSTQLGVINQNANYNNGDQLQAAGNQTYRYDSNGRLKTKTRTTDDGAIITTTYQYSSDGRLLKVTTPEKTIEYRHNALGNRVAKLVNGQVVEKYLWQNKTTLLATFDANGNLKKRFEYTLGHAPTAFTQDGEKYFILTDQIGSPRIITDSIGNIVKEITYDSYGNILNDSNESFELPFGFAGGMHDKDTGLIRFGYRDYDPETGRWTARDPIGFEGGDSNLYGYVLGDPINLVDPDGLIGLSQAVAAIGAITIAKGLYDYNQNQRELKIMRDSIAHAYRIRERCISPSACPMPYKELSSYLEALERVERRYIEKTGQSGFDLASSLNGRRTRNIQLPKKLPFCD